MSQPNQHPLFDIWKDLAPGTFALPWMVQLFNYVGRFESEEKAKKYVEAVRAYRDKSGLDQHTKADHKDTSRKSSSTAPSKKL